MYGENSGQLRTELATLLRQHRVQQRLGGPGIHTVPVTTTVQERQLLGEQIARYRQGALLWCLQAARTASPQIKLDGTTATARGPAGELHRRLDVAVTGSGAVLPSLDELTTPQEFPMLETWRHVARAAALGEHDFGAGLGYSYLNESQCRTVLKDSAEITLGLVVLDRRYARIPGWERMQDQGWLAHAAQACARSVGNATQDLSVDLQGWEPPLLAIGEPVPPGLAGILQGEHNLLVHLAQFPDAHNMRRILDSQRIVSHQAASRASTISPALAKKWETRTETFTALLHATRNLRGPLGNGGPAAAQGANVVSRMQKLAPHEMADSTELDQLDRLFSLIDVKLAQIVEHGISRQLYFLRVKLPRVTSQSVGLVQSQRVRYAPINSPVQSGLIKIVRTRLRLPSLQPRSSAGARRSRLDFEAAITHRPEMRGSIGL